MLLVRTEFLMLSMIIGILMLPVRTRLFDVASKNWYLNFIDEIICHEFESWALTVGLNPIDKIVLP